MENLMRSATEAYNAVVCGVGYPQFTLTENEAAQLLEACERAHIKGPLLDKISTVCNYATAKSRYAGRISIVKME